jgi:hypothetical protein
MARLAFAQRFGSAWANRLLRRRIRLARLRLAAEPWMIAEVAARLARAEGTETHPTMPPQPTEPERVPTPEPTPNAEPVDPPSKPRPRARKVHQPSGLKRRRVADGAIVADYRPDAARLMRESVTLTRPMGMSNGELMAAYDPPIGERTAQGIASAARREAREALGLSESSTVNGHVPHLDAVP